MKKRLLFPLLFISCIASARQTPAAGQTYNAQPGFTENKGQLKSPDVLFKAAGADAGIYVTTSGITYVFHSDVAPACMTEEATRVTRNWSKVEMELNGAAIRAGNIVREQALPGVSNFYYAHCPQGILGVQSFKKITIKEVYPGIDWVLTADAEKGFAHDFVVHPGADTKQLRVIYKGADNVTTDGDMLVITSQYGTLREGRLHVYEEATGNKVNAEFIVLRKMQLKYRCKWTPVEYRLGTYDTRQSVIIDPPLQWSMPQASTDFDYGYAVCSARDGSGDVLMTGSTYGADFPDTAGYQGTLYGYEDMVVVRLDPNGVREWATYYGGTDYEQGKGIAADASGNCYVTGNTGSNDFPVLNPLQANYGNGVYDLAVVKFDPSGVRQWATWYGSFGNEYGTAIASDANGDVYVTGYTNSQFFVTTSNALQTTKDAGYDGFIMKVSTNCALQWCTFYGGNDDDKIRAIAIDASGANIYLTGSTMAAGFPITAGTFQAGNASAFVAEEAFITKISAAQVVQFSSFCGGSDADFGQGITVDNSGNIYITGYTTSADFPTTGSGGAYVDTAIGSIGTHDAFVVGVNSTGTTRFWSTYFGGTMPDMGFAIACDPFVGVYICGNTASTDFPVMMPADNNYYQATHGDGGIYNDMFIAWFDINDSLRWSTYYGGANSDEAYGIATDALNNIFVTGVENNDMAALKFNPGVPTGGFQAVYYGFNMWPTLAHDELNIRFETGDLGIYRLRIFSMNGQLVSEEPAAVNTPWIRNQYRLDVSALVEGAYFLMVVAPDGSARTERFVKR